MVAPGELIEYSTTTFNGRSYAEWPWHLQEEGPAGAEHPHVHVLTARPHEAPRLATTPLHTDKPTTIIQPTRKGPQVLPFDGLEEGPPYLFDRVSDDLLDRALAQADAVHHPRRLRQLTAQLLVPATATRSQEARHMVEPPRRSGLSPRGASEAMDNQLLSVDGRVVIPGLEEKRLPG